MLKNINKTVLFIVSFFIIICLQSILFYKKEELHLLINQHHNIFFDFFFKYITYLGDGLVFVFAIIICFFFKKIESLKFMIASVLTIVFVSFLKRVVFNTPRPIEVFGTGNIHLIEGVKMAHWNSLPSGHTTTAFAIATLLLVNIKNKILQFIIACLAILTSFSRIYLSLHFVIDVFVGSLLGIFIGILSIKITNKIIGYKFYKK